MISQPIVELPVTPIKVRPQPLKNTTVEIVEIVEPPVKRAKIASEPVVTRENRVKHFPDFIFEDRNGVKVGIKKYVQGEWPQYFCLECNAQFHRYTELYDHFIDVRTPEQIAMDEEAEKEPVEEEEEPNFVIGPLRCVDSDEESFVDCENSDEEPMESEEDSDVESDWSTARKEVVNVKSVTNALRSSNLHSDSNDEPTKGSSKDHYNPRLSPIPEYSDDSDVDSVKDGKPVEKPLRFYGLLAEDSDDEPDVKQDKKSGSVKGSVKRLSKGSDRKSVRRALRFTDSDSDDELDVKKQKKSRTAKRQLKYF